MMEVWQMILSFDMHLPQLVAMHANIVYLILFCIVFLQIGVLPFFFLPSNPFLFVCGAVWAVSQLSILLLLAVLILAAIFGSLSGYWLGKRVGQAFFVDYLKWPNQAALDKTRVFYDKHGEKGLLGSLFLPVIRTLAPFLAGVTHMQFVKFMRSVSIGAVVWVLVCVLTGYFFGNIPIVQKHLGTLALLGLAIVMAVYLANRGWNRLNKC
jgi:membrane-associated protein